MAEPGSDEEFNFYLKLAKPLVLNLSEPTDRVKASAWINKLREEDFAEAKVRTDHLKLLLFVLQRKRLVGVFTEDPNKYSKLEDFSPELKLQDAAKKILEDELAERRKFAETGSSYPPYEVEWSSDMLEYSAAQEIPNFGVQAFYALSKEPVYFWDRPKNGQLPKDVITAGTLDIQPVDLTALAPPEPPSLIKKRFDKSHDGSGSGLISELESSIKEKPASPIVPLGDPSPPQDRINPTWGSNLINVSEPPVKDTGPPAERAESPVKQPVAPEQRFDYDELQKYGVTKEDLEYDPLKDLAELEKEKIELSDHSTSLPSDEDVIPSDDSLTKFQKKLAYYEQTDAIESPDEDALKQIAIPKKKKPKTKTALTKGKVASKGTLVKKDTSIPSISGKARIPKLPCRPEDLKKYDLEVVVKPGHEIDRMEEDEEQQPVAAQDTSFDNQYKRLEEDFKEMAAEFDKWDQVIKKLEEENAEDIKAVEEYEEQLRAKGISPSKVMPSSLPQLLQKTGDVLPAQEEPADERSKWLDMVERIEGDRLIDQTPPQYPPSYVDDLSLTRTPEKFGESPKYSGVIGRKRRIDLSASRDLQTRTGIRRRLDFQPTPPPQEWQDLVEGLDDACLLEQTPPELVQSAIDDLSISDYTPRGPKLPPQFRKPATKRIIDQPGMTPHLPPDDRKALKEVARKKLDFPAVKKQPYKGLVKKTTRERVIKDGIVQKDTHTTEIIPIGRGKGKRIPIAGPPTDKDKYKSKSTDRRIGRGRGRGSELPCPLSSRVPKQKETALLPIAGPPRTAISTTKDKDKSKTTGKRVGRGRGRGSGIPCPSDSRIPRQEEAASLPTAGPSGAVVKRPSSAVVKSSPKYDESLVKGLTEGLDVSFDAADEDENLNIPYEAEEMALLMQRWKNEVEKLEKGWAKDDAALLTAEAYHPPTLESVRGKLHYWSEEEGRAKEVKEQEVRKPEVLPATQELQICLPEQVPKVPALPFSESPDLEEDDNEDLIKKYNLEGIDLDNLDVSFGDVDNIKVTEADISPIEYEDMDKYDEVERGIKEMDDALNKWDAMIAELEREHADEIREVEEMEKRQMEEAASGPVCPLPSKRSPYITPTSPKAAQAVRPMAPGIPALPCPKASDSPLTRGKGKDEIRKRIDFGLPPAPIVESPKEPVRPTKTSLDDSELYKLAGINLSGSLDEYDSTVDEEDRVPLKAIEYNVRPDNEIDQMSKVLNKLDETIKQMQKEQAGEERKQTDAYTREKKKDENTSDDELKAFEELEREFEKCDEPPALVRDSIFGTRPMQTDDIYKKAEEQYRRLRLGNEYDTYEQYLKQRVPGAPQTPPIFSKFKVIRDEAKDMVYDPQQFGVCPDEEWKEGAEALKDLAPTPPPVDPNEQFFVFESPPQLIDQEKDYEEEEAEKEDLKRRLKLAMEDVERIKREMLESMGLPLTFPTSLSSPIRSVFTSAHDEPVNLLDESPVPIVESPPSSESEDSFERHEREAAAENVQICPIQPPTKPAIEEAEGRMQELQRLTQQQYEQLLKSPEKQLPIVKAKPTSPFEVDSRQLKKDIEEKAVRPEDRPHMELVVGGTAGRRRKLRKHSKKPKVGKIVEREEEFHDVIPEWETPPRLKSKPIAPLPEPAQFDLWEGTHAPPLPYTEIKEVTQKIVDGKPVEKVSKTITKQISPSRKSPEGVIDKEPKYILDETPPELIDESEKEEDQGPVTTVTEVTETIIDGLPVEKILKTTETRQYPSPSKASDPLKAIVQRSPVKDLLDESGTDILQQSPPPLSPKEADDLKKTIHRMATPSRRPPTSEYSPIPTPEAYRRPRPQIKETPPEVRQQREQARRQYMEQFAGLPQLPLPENLMGEIVPVQTEPCPAAIIDEPLPEDQGQLPSPIRPPVTIPGYETPPRMRYRRITSPIRGYEPVDLGDITPPPRGVLDESFPSYHSPQDSIEASLQSLSDFEAEERYLDRHVKKRPKKKIRTNQLEAIAQKADIEEAARQQYAALFSPEAEPQDDQVIVPHSTPRTARIRNIHEETPPFEDDSRGDSTRSLEDFEDLENQLKKQYANIPTERRIIKVPKLESMVQTAQVEDLARRQYEALLHSPTCAQQDIEQERPQLANINVLDTSPPAFPQSPPQLSDSESTSEPLVEEAHPTSPIAPRREVQPLPIRTSPASPPHEIEPQEFRRQIRREATRPEPRHHVDLISGIASGRRTRVPRRSTGPQDRFFEHEEDFEIVNIPGWGTPPHLETEPLPPRPVLQPTDFWGVADEQPPAPQPEYTRITEEIVDGAPIRKTIQTITTTQTPPHRTTGLLEETPPELIGDQLDEDLGERDQIAANTLKAIAQRSPERNLLEREEFEFYPQSPPLMTAEQEAAARNEILPQKTPPRRPPTTEFSPLLTPEAFKRPPTQYVTPEDIKQSRRELEERRAARRLQAVQPPPGIDVTERTEIFIDGAPAQTTETHITSSSFTSPTPFDASAQSLSDFETEERYQSYVDRSRPKRRIEMPTLQAIAQKAEAEELARQQYAALLSSPEESPRATRQHPSQTAPCPLSRSPEQREASIPPALPTVSPRRHARQQLNVMDESPPSFVDLSDEVSPSSPTPFDASAQSLSDFETEERYQSYVDRSKPKRKIEMPTLQAIAQKADTEELARQQYAALLSSPEESPRATRQPFSHTAPCPASRPPVTRASPPLSPEYRPRIPLMEESPPLFVDLPDEIDYNEQHQRKSPITMQEIAARGDIAFLDSVNSISEQRQKEQTSPTHRRPLVTYPVSPGSPEHDIDPRMFKKEIREKAVRPPPRTHVDLRTGRGAALPVRVYRQSTGPDTRFMEHEDDFEIVNIPGWRTPPHLEREPLPPVGPVPLEDMWTTVPPRRAEIPPAEYTQITEEFVDGTPVRRTERTVKSQTPLSGVSPPPFVESPEGAQYYAFSPTLLERMGQQSPLGDVSPPYFAQTPPATTAPQYDIFRPSWPDYEADELIDTTPPELVYSPPDRPPFRVSSARKSSPVRRPRSPVLAPRSPIPTTRYSSPVITEGRTSPRHSSLPKSSAPVEVCPIPIPDARQPGIFATEATSTDVSITDPIMAERGTPDRPILAFEGRTSPGILDTSPIGRNLSLESDDEYSDFTWMD